MGFLELLATKIAEKIVESARKFIRIFYKKKKNREKIQDAFDNDDDDALNDAFK